MLATNTSALSVTEIAAATTRPDRVVGHALLQPGAADAARGGGAGGAHLGRGRGEALGVVERLGKVAVPCHDTPGFVVNRVLIPLLNDCVRVLDEARVEPQALDAAMTSGAAWPMGPCALLDLVGIDVHVHASEALYGRLREPRMAPPAPARRDAGRGAPRPQGGRGFYPYG